MAKGSGSGTRAQATRNPTLNFAASADTKPLGQLWASTATGT